MNQLYKYLFFIAIMYVPVNIYAQENSTEKYWLFNPVKQADMRKMETDRPDVTESPFTVDAGHIQYETDLIRIIRERSDNQRSRTVLINSANIKFGITSFTALQIGVQSFGRQKETELVSGATEINSGIGDITVRIKHNIVGNDGGNFALAILPYLKFPTSVYDKKSKYEGGLIVPMLYHLPGKWQLGMQIEADRLRDNEGQMMHNELLQSLTVSHDLVKSIAGIAETYYTYDFKGHQWSNFLNAALQIELVKDLKMDAGLNYGIQKSASRQCFIGASCRF